MEQREIFLEKNKSRVSVNKENELAVSLSTKTRVLPYNDIDEKISLYKLYNSERDACNRYRMIFTVNPICTNVLFNARTEIVRREGAPDCTVLPKYIDDYSGLNNGNFINSSRINTLQAIRDTEYTHKGFFKDEDPNPYVYHCGWDIFNNHMLRSDDFVHISKVNGDSRAVFNTIKDFLRDRNGNIVEEKINVNNKDKITRLHVYQYDNILTMYNAFKTRLDEKNGWYGFTNPGNIEIDNADVTVEGVHKTISINRMMNNNKSCELYELYPDQSLYSFIPKVNRFRNRLEYNWDYDLVYPYENEYDLLKEIVGTNGKWVGDDTPLKILEASRTSSTAGSDYVLLKTMFKHTLKSGDYVKLYHGDTLNQDENKINRRFKVVRCGDIYGNGTNRYFCIRATDLSSDFTFDDNGKVVYTDDTTKPVNFYYKKDINGYECKYYIRKLKRLKTERFESEINKLAFGENIYGDRMAQIIFTDDIDVEGLVDNLGRPLSEVYLYVFKTNRGHDKWYKQGIYNDEEIEFSHCFGKVTSGLDLPSGENDYNVRCLHNVDVNEIDAQYLNGFNYVYKHSVISGGTFKSIQDDLKLEDLDNDGFVYGDVVEFNPYNYTETIIENIYHRFNTAQRETTNSTYYDLWDDEIVFDDYDEDVNKSNFAGSWTSTTNRINLVKDDNNSDIRFPGNISPEGYFYNPKTAIKLLEVSEDVTSVSTKQIKYSLVDNALYYLPSPDGYDEEGNPVRYLHGKFDISTTYEFIKGDFIALYQSDDGCVHYGVVDSVSGKTIDIAFSDDNIYVDGLLTGSTAMLTTREYVAPYAVFLPSSRSFVWRNLVKPSELPNDSALYDRPFSNGCFYIHQNVNFFLKRQDPRNEFGLLYPEEANDNNEPQTKYYKKPGNSMVDLSSYDNLYNIVDNICY